MPANDLFNLFEDMEGDSKILKPPTTYQGSKAKLADKILDIVKPNPSELFYDLCCGSGAISIALMNRGFDPFKLTMVDSGPWGLFWNQIGQDTFDFGKLECLASKMLCGDFDANILRLAESPLDSMSLVPTFLILQSVSFGGKAVWIKDGKWKHPGFVKDADGARTYVPVQKKLSNLLERIPAIQDRMEGVEGIHSDITKVRTFRYPCLVYIDPPYRNTIDYQDDFNVEAYIGTFDQGRIFVSEGFGLKNADKCHFLGTRHVGPMSKSSDKEWLSEIIQGA